MENRTVTRREVLHSLLLSLGCASGLAACAGGGTQLLSPAPDPGASVPRYYTIEEFSFLAQLADGLIPTTDTPGAVDVGVPVYIDALMADWASNETKKSHREVVAAVRRELATTSLEDLDAAAFGERREVLGEYRDLKNLIATVYYVTEPGAILEAGWVSVPGRWEHCAPFEELDQASWDTET